MPVCDAKRCKKRELCINYIDNYFHFNPNSGPQQVIDWSNYGNCTYSNDENGNMIKKETWDCGDLSDNYPKFESIELDKL